MRPGQHGIKASWHHGIMASWHQVGAREGLRLESFRQFGVSTFPPPLRSLRLCGEFLPEGLRYEGTERAISHQRHSHRPSPRAEPGANAHPSWHMAHPFLPSPWPSVFQSSPNHPCPSVLICGYFLSAFSAPLR